MALSIFALASGIAARLKPKAYANADVEITRLRQELREARVQIDVMRIALMRQIADSARVVDCTGGGRGRYLAGRQEAYERQQTEAYRNSACHKYFNAWSG